MPGAAAKPVYTPKSAARLCGGRGLGLGNYKREQSLLSLLLRMAMFCLLACLPLRGYSAPVPSFRHLLTDEASRLQDNISAVNAIAQDQQGFIWVGARMVWPVTTVTSLCFSTAVPQVLALCAATMFYPWWWTTPAHCGLAPAGA